MNTFAVASDGCAYLPQICGSTTKYFRLVKFILIFLDGRCCEIANFEHCLINSEKKRRLRNKRNGSHIKCMKWPKEMPFFTGFDTDSLNIALVHHRHVRFAKSTVGSFNRKITFKWCALLLSHSLACLFQLSRPNLLKICIMTNVNRTNGPVTWFRIV